MPNRLGLKMNLPEASYIRCIELVEPWVSRTRLSHNRGCLVLEYAVDGAVLIAIGTVRADRPMRTPIEIVTMFVCAVIK